MMNLMVNYCIGAYERPPPQVASPTLAQDPEWKKKLSIRQMFSNYVNAIVGSSLST